MTVLIAIVGVIACIGWLCEMTIRAQTKDYYFDLVLQIHAKARRAVSERKDAQEAAEATVDALRADNDTLRRELGQVRSYVKLSVRGMEGRGFKSKNGKLERSKPFKGLKKILCASGVQSTRGLADEIEQ